MLPAWQPIGDSLIPKRAELGTIGSFEFFQKKKLFFCISFEINNLFLHQSYLKSQLPVKLTWKKMQKLILYYSNKYKIPKVPSSAKRLIQADGWKALREEF